MKLPNKSLGQHWLYDEKTLDSICLDAEIVDGDNVLEIGPGLGTLTARLLNFGAKVSALEYDHELFLGLKENTKKRLHNSAEIDNLDVVEGDIRNFDFSKMPQGYKICANIPYYLTSNLLRRLCDTESKPERVALLMQKEVTQRVVAEDGRMSLISCFVQFFYDTFEGTPVPAGLFTPPPKVDSLVLILSRREKPLFDVDQKLFFRLIKYGFAGKRKNLKNTLSSGFGVSKDKIESLLDQAVIDSNRRAETLSLYEWKTIYDLLDTLSTE